MQERGEQHILSFCATRRTRYSALGALCEAPSAERVELARFLRRSLRYTTSATLSRALFGSFAGTTRSSDFARSCITGLRPSPCRTTSRTIKTGG